MATGEYSTPAEPPATETVNDVVYAAVGGRALHMDLLRPAQPGPEPLPVIIEIHGGAFTRGTRDAERNRLLAEHGFFTASIDYRLAPEATFPAQLHDAKAAVRWLRAHAKELQIDPLRIGVWGESAGGQLAALLGTTGNVAELEGYGGWAGHSSAVQAVYVGCAVTDMFEHKRLMPLEDPPGVTEALLGGPLERSSEIARLASPVAHVHAGCPPFLIVHGDADHHIPIRNSELLYEALRATECDATFIRIARAGHLGLGANPRLRRIRLDFFRRHFYLSNSPDSW